MNLMIKRSVMERPTDSTRSTTSGQTDTTSGQTSTTSGQTNGQTSSTSGHQVRRVDKLVLQMDN